MEIIELINACKIEDAGNGMLRIWNVAEGKKHNDEIKAKKPELLAYFSQKKAEKEAASKAREDRINAIEGLEIIRKALSTEMAYERAFNHMMDNEYNDGVNPPTKPAASSVELKKQYPRAAAYLKAEDWECASHYAKSAAGRRAKERIINGEDYNKVIADMDAEWSAHCDQHLWD